MINSSLLKSEIEKAGYKYSFIAKQLSISSQSFYNKVNNITEFTVGQVFILKQVLSLDDQVLKEIFFVKSITSNVR